MRMRSRTGLGAVTLALLFAALVSVGRVDRAEAASTTVQMVGTQFVPPVADIKTGETVTWENAEPANYPVVIGVHNVVSDDGAFSPSPPINPGESWTYAFKKPGTFKYHCGIHPNQMRGTVNVTGDPVPESSTSTAPGGGSSTPTTAPSGGGGGGSGTGPQGGGGETVRRVELTVAEKDFPVLGVPMTWWTYGGTVPGTTLRANVGDTIEIVLKNTHNLPHAIHTHFENYDVTSDGSSMTAPLPVVPHQEDDTVGAVGGIVPGVAGDAGPAVGQNPIGPYEPRGDRDVAGPGKTYTYRYKLEEAGTSWYHCHVLEATDHISKGLFGFIIVYPKGWKWEELPPDPRNGNTKAWVTTETGERLFEDLVIIGERNPSPGAALPTDSAIGLAAQGGAVGGLIHHANGRAWNDPYVVGPVRTGQKLLLHVGNIGESAHSWHVHGHHMTRMQMFDPVGVHQRGWFTSPLEHMHNLGLLSGDIFPTQITAGKPGFWFEHDHVVPDAYLGMVPWLHVLPAGTESAAGASLPASADVSMVEPNQADPNSWAFEPPDVTIAKGGTVTWKNSGKQDHDVNTSDGAPEGFSSGTMKGGATWSKTFEQVGDYSYYCSFHPWMKGTVRVREQGTAASSSGSAPAAGSASSASSGSAPSSAVARSAGGGAAATTAPARADVKMVEPKADDAQGWSFNPPDVVVRTGGTVTWTNEGKQLHNAISTDDPKAFESSNLKTGEKFEHTFERTGTFAYECSLHPWMKGTVRVVEPGTVVQGANISAGSGGLAYPPQVPNDVNMAAADPGAGGTMGIAARGSGSLPTRIVLAALAALAIPGTFVLRRFRSRRA